MKAAVTQTSPPLTALLLSFTSCSHYFLSLAFPPSHPPAGSGPPVLRGGRPRGQRGGGFQNPGGVALHGSPAGDPLPASPAGRLCLVLPVNHVFALCHLRPPEPPRMSGHTPPRGPPGVGPWGPISCPCGSGMVEQKKHPSGTVWTGEPPLNTTQSVRSSRKIWI